MGTKKRKARRKKALARIAQGQGFGVAKKGDKVKRLGEFDFTDATPGSPFQPGDTVKTKGGIKTFTKPKKKQPKL